MATVTVNSHNIYLSVGKKLKGEKADIPSKEIAEILKGDKDAGRAPRLTKEAKRETS